MGDSTTMSLPGDGNARHSLEHVSHQRHCHLTSIGGQITEPQTLQSMELSHRVCAKCWVHGVARVVAIHTLR